MNQPPSAPDEPGLFDLPLQVDGPQEDAESVVAEESARPRRSRRGATRETMPLFQGGEGRPREEVRPLPLDRLPQAPPAEPEERQEWPRLAHGARTAAPAEIDSEIEPQLGENADAGVGARFKAALADLVVFAAVTAIVLVGTLRFGVTLRWSDWPAYALFVLTFSFLYSVISLAFWGQTPGMVWAGIVARGEEADALAFGQTARRWAAGLLTVALVGLPGLLALRGRSLADRLSGSRTYSLDASPAR